MTSSDAVSLLMNSQYYKQGYSDAMRDFRKILKNEIDRQEKWLLQAGYTAYNVDIAFDSIKRVIAESGEE